MGVSFDSVPENAAFAQKFDFPYPLLCDTARSLGIAYGACDDATARSARRISYLIGPDGRVRKAYAKVDTATHAETVLRDLG